MSILAMQLMHDHLRLCHQSQGQKVCEQQVVTCQIWLHCRVRYCHLKVINQAKLKVNKKARTYM